MYSRQVQKNIEYFSNNNIYILFDETTDTNGRYILNILIGECSENIREIPVLVKLVELTKTNAANIFKEILNFLIKLHSGMIEYDKKSF